MPRIKIPIYSVIFALILMFSSSLFADESCKNDCRAQIRFIEFTSIDIATVPPTPIKIKGKLKIPYCLTLNQKCVQSNKKFAAVVVLHGSSGVDSRGDFYARELNAAGIATLEIDMWEARGISSPENRPQLPIYNYPDAFGALQYLTQHPSIDANRIGVMGFSWGAVITMASATETYSSMFGGNLRFAAHVAHYPVCYAYNSWIPGSDFTQLTGAPLLIQIGDHDDYDEGSSACFALKESLLLNDPENYHAVEVIAYENAYHAWDRLQVSVSVPDPFSHLGQGGQVEINPNVDQAYKSRRRVVDFFRSNL